MGILQKISTIAAVSPSVAPLGQALEHKRWMLFVDGENLTARARDVANADDMADVLKVGPYYEPEVFVWVPRVQPNVSFIDIQGGYPLLAHGHRAHYFTAVQGSDERLKDVRKRIRDFGFQPEVFRKPVGKHAKRVDIALAAFMLGEAFRDHYDVAVLMTGDEDYVPAVKELQAAGKSVYLAFFDHERGGLSSELRLACDSFFDMTDAFFASWIRHWAGAKDSGDAFTLST